MAVTLTKIVEGTPAVPYMFTNGFTVCCPFCEQAYWFGYSGEEWHQLRHWRQLVVKALRKDHDLTHEAATVTLEWSGIRRR